MCSEPNGNRCERRAGGGDSSDLGDFWGPKFHKMGDSLLWTPTNRPAEFDADSFILGGEIRNRTNTQKNKQTNQPNKHTHTQPVTDISTFCLSACVDSKICRTPLYDSPGARHKYHE